MKDYITVATFHAVEKAEPLRARLQEAGIPAATADETALQRFLFFSTPRAAFKVRVTKDDFDRASQYVIQHGELMRFAVKCPDCGSSRVQYPQYTRKFFIPALAALARSLVGAKRKYYCQV